MSLKNKMKLLFRSSDTKPVSDDPYSYRKNKAPDRSENRKISVIVAEGFVEDKLSEITGFLNESNDVFLSESYLSVNKNCWHDIASVLIEFDFCSRAKVKPNGIECERSKKC